jgi:hypothetical protein
MAEELDVGELSFVQAWPEIAELRSKKLSGSITKDEKKRLNALENVYSRNINTTMNNFGDNLMPADNDLLKEYNANFLKLQGSSPRPPYHLQLGNQPFLNPENEDIFKEPVPDIETIIPTSSEHMTLRMMRKIKSNEKLLKEIHQEIVKFISNPVKMTSDSAWVDCGDNYGRPKYEGMNGKDTYKPKVQEMWRIKQLFSYFGLDDLSKVKVISKRRDRFTKVVQSDDEKEQNETENDSKTSEYKKLLNKIGLNDDLSMVTDNNTGVYERLGRYDTRLYHNLSFSDTVKAIMFRTNIYAYYPELVGRTGINYLIRESTKHGISLHTQYRPSILYHSQYTHNTPYNYRDYEEWKVFGDEKKGVGSSRGLQNEKTMVGVVNKDYFTVGDWKNARIGRPNHTEGNTYISKGEFLCAPSINWSRVMNHVDYYVISKLLLDFADEKYAFKDMKGAEKIANSVENALTSAVSKIPKPPSAPNFPTPMQRNNALKEVMKTICQDGSKLVSNPKKYDGVMNAFLQELYDSPMPISYGTDDPYQPNFSNVTRRQYSAAEGAWFMQPMVGSGYANHTILFFLLAMHNELCEINGVIPMNVKESLIDPATRGIVLYNGGPYRKPTKSGRARSKKFNDAQRYQGKARRYEHNRSGCEWHGIGFDYSSEMEEPEGINTTNYNRYLLFKEVTIANVYSDTGIDEENPLDWFANNGLRSKKFLGYVGGKLIQPKVDLDWSPINDTYEIQMKAILNDLKKINSIADTLRNNSLSLLLKNQRMQSLMKSIEEASDEDTSKAVGKGRWKPTNRFIEGRESWGGFVNRFTQYFASIYVEFGPNSPASASETGQGSGWGGPTEYTNAQVRDALISKYGKDWWNAFVKMYYAYKEKEIKERLDREKYLIKNMGDWEKDDLME